MRLLIAYPNPFSYSETFIRDHISQLQPIETLTGGWQPFLTKEKKTIFGGLLKLDIIRAGLRRYFKPVYDWFYMRALAKFLMEEKVSIVLAEYGITAVNMHVVCQKLGIPIVAHFHGFDAFEYKTIDIYRQRYIQMAKAAKSIIVVSNDMKIQLVGFGIEPSKIVVNSCGVDVQKFPFVDTSINEEIVMFTGRFTGKKAPDKTILAFNKVLHRFPNAILWMVGDGEEFQTCKSLITNLGIEHHVKLFGVQKPEEISKLLRQARVFTQHSVRTEGGDSEGTPVALLEAAASGLPIVATLHGGIKEAVVHGKTGYLVTEGDYNSQAEYISNVLEMSRNDHYQMGKASNLHVAENYSMSRQIGNIKKILEAN